MEEYDTQKSACHVDSPVHHGRLHALWHAGLIGALLGVVVIYPGLNGYSTNSNFLSNTQSAFSFVITPGALIYATRVPVSPEAL